MKLWFPDRKTLTVILAISLFINGMYLVNIIQMARHNAEMISLNYRNSADFGIYKIRLSVRDKRNIETAMDEIFLGSKIGIVETRHGKYKKSLWYTKKRMFGIANDPEGIRARISFLPSTKLIDAMFDSNNGCLSVSLYTYGIASTWRIKPFPIHVREQSYSIQGEYNVVIPLKASTLLSNLKKARENEYWSIISAEMGERSLKAVPDSVGDTENVINIRGPGAEAPNGDFHYSKMIAYTVRPCVRMEVDEWPLLVPPEEKRGKAND